MKSLIVIAIACFMLAGCASKNDVSMMNSYYTANTNHNTEQTKQVASKSNAIQNAVKINCDSNDPNCAVAKAMSGVVSAMFISGITPQEFTTKAPTTGVNVQEKVIGVIGSGIPWVTVGVVASKGIESAGDTTTASGGSTLNKAEGDISTSQTEEVVFKPEEEEVSIEEPTE